MNPLNTSAMSVAIREVISLCGVEILAHADRFRAAIKDYLFDTSFNKERQILIFSISIGVGKELLKAVAQSTSEQKRILIVTNKLLIEHGFVQIQNNSILEAFVTALGWDIVEIFPTATLRALAEDEEKEQTNKLVSDYGYQYWEKRERSKQCALILTSVVMLIGFAIGMFLLIFNLSFFNALSWFDDYWKGILSIAALWLGVPIVFLLLLTLVLNFTDAFEDHKWLVSIIATAIIFLSMGVTKISLAPGYDWRYKLDDGQLVGIVDAYYGSKEEVQIPDTINVVEISDGAFAGNTKITKITIPDSVQYIGKDVLRDCTSLIEVSVPFIGATRGDGQVDKIESGDETALFSYLFGYYWIVEPYEPGGSGGSGGSGEEPGGSGGSGEEPGGSGGGGGSGEETIKESRIPESIKIIRITDAKIIPTTAFNRCTGVEYIYLNEGITSIGDWAFSYCYSLKEMTIPQSVEYIGASILYYSQELETLSVPFIGKENRDYSIDAVEYEDAWLPYLFGWTWSDSMLNDNANNQKTRLEGLSKSYIPETLKTIYITNAISIPMGAFRGNSNIEIISITNTVESVGIYAFPIPLKTGYTFLGWASSQDEDATLYTDADGELLIEAFTISENDKAIFLYAKWQANTYEVTLDIDSDVSISENYANVTFGEISALPIPSRAGYEFIGWCSDAAANNLITNSAGTLLSGWSYAEEIALYAKWSLAKYNITVTRNLPSAGTISGNTEVEYTSSVSLHATVNLGYTFDGWYVNGIKQASSLSYSFVMPATDVTIQAIWAAKTFTVTLNANGGSVSQSSKTVTFGSPYTFPNATRNGYVFDGWYTNKTGGNELTGSSWNIVSSSGNFTAYAHWVAISDVTISLTKKNCADNNGYNPNSPAGEDDDKTRHNNFEMVKLVVSNAVQSSGGYYYIPEGNTLSLKLAVQRSTTGLPLNSGETAKQIADDTYTGSIHGTDISGARVGYGAYYVKVTYTDGTTYEKNATNILSGKSSGSIINMNINVDASKKIKSVQVIVVYEILTNGAGFLGIWWNEYTNWQCSTILNFNY